VILATQSAYHQKKKISLRDTLLFVDTEKELLVELSIAVPYFMLSYYSVADGLNGVKFGGPSRACWACGG
jgi:hypothetical protein